MTKQIKSILIFIVFLAVLVFLAGLYVLFENNLEDSAYAIINKNLWIGIPLVIVGYIIFETVKRRFGKQLIESNYVEEKMIETLKESDGPGKWFVFDYLNGKCPDCGNNFLSAHITEKYSKSDKILKCSECQSLCIKSFPDEWIASPMFLAGGIIFLSEWAGEYERQVMLGSLVLSLAIAWFISKFWVNKKLASDEELND